MRRGKPRAGAQARWAAWLALAGLACAGSLVASPASAADGDDWTAEPIKSLGLGVGDGYLAELAAIGDTVFFNATDGLPGGELWKSDGTTAGTQLVWGQDPEGSPYPYGLSVVNDTLYFITGNVPETRQFWESDGTADGTRMVKVRDKEWLDPPTALTVVGDRLFFFATNTQEGGLWVSDGSISESVKIADVGWDVGQELVVMGDRLFFTQGDKELWTSDGTTAGTVMVTDVDLDLDDHLWWLKYSHNLTVVGDRLFFVADDGVHGSELWTSDGTAEGTLMVKDIYPDSLEWPRDEPPKYLAAMGDRLFFAADDGVHGHELWTSDGTAEGTVMVKDIHPDGSDSSSPKGLTAVGNRLFFTADDGVHGDELWVSDGTEQGTAMVKDIRPGSADGGAGSPVVMGELLFFISNDGVHDVEPWISDGTAEGTVMVADINPSGSSFMGPYPMPLALVVAGDSVYFTADDGEHGLELWRVSRPEPVPPVDLEPSNKFTLPASGKANLKQATLSLSLKLPGPGRVKLSPVEPGRLKAVSKVVGANGKVTVKLKATKATKAKLRKQLRVQQKRVASVRVRVKVTYTPDGGLPRTQTKTYVIKLKKPAR